MANTILVSASQIHDCTIIIQKYRHIVQGTTLNTRDLKSLRVDSPCDNLFQSAINSLYKIHFLIINGAPHPILSKICLMDKIPCVFIFYLEL